MENGLRKLQFGLTDRQHIAELVSKLLHTAMYTHPHTYIHAYSST